MWKLVQADGEALISFQRLRKKKRAWKRFVIVAQITRSLGQCGSTHAQDLMSGAILVTACITSPTDVSEISDSRSC